MTKPLVPRIQGYDVASKPDDASMRLVIVNWIDSGGYSRWTSLKDIKATGVKRCRSVGWVVHETDESLWIVPHLDNKDPDLIGMGLGDLCIPKGTITSVTTLSETTKAAQ